MREGCYTCHSQMVRPFRDELERYGPYSLAAESMYDHPFQWGSKRTGRTSRAWAAATRMTGTRRICAPRAALVPASVMPPYAFLDRSLDYADIQDRMRALRAVGVAYTDDMIASARADLEAQARPDADAADFQGRYARARQAAFDGDLSRITEMDALVAYLQMLGTLVEFRDVTPARSCASREEGAMDRLIELLPLFRTLWVVWFFLLFIGMLWLVLRPSRKSHYEAQADIPLRDEVPAHSMRGHSRARVTR